MQPSDSSDTSISSNSGIESPLNLAKKKVREANNFNPSQASAEQKSAVNNSASSNKDKENPQTASQKQAGNEVSKAKGNNNKNTSNGKSLSKAQISKMKKNFNKYVNKGMKGHKRRQYKKSMSDMYKAHFTSLSWTTSKEWYVAGDNSYHLKDYDNSVYQYKHAIKLGKKDKTSKKTLSNYFYRMALSYFYEFKYYLCKDCLYKALKFNSKSAKVYEKLGTMNNGDKSIEYLEKACLLSNNNRYLRQLSITERQNHYTNSAIRDALKATLRNQSLYNWLILGEALYSESKRTSFNSHYFAKHSIICYLRCMAIFGHKGEINMAGKNNFYATKCCYHLHLYYRAGAHSMMTNKCSSNSNYLIYSAEVNHKLAPLIRNDPVSGNNELDGIQELEIDIEDSPYNIKGYRALSHMYSDAGFPNASSWMTKIANVLDDVKYGHSKDASTSNKNKDYIGKLNQLIGLSSIKHAIQSIANRAMIARIRSGNPGHQQLHLIFEGAPGTGKTTVADLMCGIYIKST